MSDAEQILAVLHQFEESGLIHKDAQALSDCISQSILGIGLGEQGFVTSKEDVTKVLEAGIKTESIQSHRIRYGRTEVRLHTDRYATVCAQVRVQSLDEAGKPEGESMFMQLLSLIKEADGAWRICALHASTPELTEESLAAYPLKIADKTLQSLKERIGEQAYQAEEQYRLAIMSDAIAFYIINVTRDRCEKCQCDTELCLELKEGEPYERHMLRELPTYAAAEDQAAFSQTFSCENMCHAFAEGEKELTLEYRLTPPSGGMLWVATIARMIEDRHSGDLKSIIYVRNIDRRKHEELALLDKATLDGMTRVYNKEAMTGETMRALRAQATGGYFVMLDVDNFKRINDSFGHVVGDRVLIEVARVLQDLFWAHGTVGRVGGDEFGVFWPDGCDADIKDQLELLRMRIAGIFLPEMPDVRISCSVGVARCEMGDEFTAFYRAADDALYVSKKSGKNKTSFFREKT